MIPLLAMLVFFAPAQKVRHPAAKHRKPAHHTIHKHPGISPERAQQIQQALVQAGYLKEASGKWDAASAAAMKKYQTDHHWQTHYIPDARALLALGLVQGPANVETAANDGVGSGGDH